MKRRILSLILVCATLLTAIPLVAFPVAATADTFTPVTRFVLVSDIHVAKHATNPGSNVDAMMNRVYAYLDEKGDNVLPSAIISMGDSLNNGWPKEGEYLASRFNAAKSGFAEKYGANLPIYAVMGNHEYNNGYFYSSPTNTEAFHYVEKDDLSDSEYFAQNTAAFAEAFIDMLWGTEAADGNANKGNIGAIDNNTTNWHYVIGGVHFIGVSLANHWGNLSNETLAWLDAELAKAAAETPNAPIFLFSHHPLRNTVYATKTGVTDWWSHYMPDNTNYNIATANDTNTQFTNIISKYPNVIFSTGHTHATGNSPLGIWQGETDGVGTGFTAYCPGGLVQASGTVGGDFAIVEIDANNTVRFYPQNVNGAYTNPDGSPLYYEVSYNNGTHTYGYNETARKAMTPEFAEDATAAFSNMWACDGVVTGTLSFPQAKSGAVYAQEYEVEFVPQDETASVYTTVASNAYARTLNIPATLYATDFKLQENKVYDVKITPVNYFGGKGETVTVLKDLATPTSELKETDSNYTSIYTHPTSGTGMNDITYSTENGTVTLAPAWSVGAYNITSKTDLPYSRLVGSSEHWGVPTTTSSLSWGVGGVYLHSQSRRIIIGYATNGYCSYVTYTAEKSGTLNFTVDNVKFYSGTYFHPYAVVKNYSTVLTADNAAFVNWDATAGAANSTWIVPTAQTVSSFTVENIEVKQGDTISFVFSRGPVNDGSGICDVKMHVDYTKEYETVNYIYENDFAQNPSHPSFPTVDYNTVLADGTYPTYALVQNPNWELGAYYFGATATSVSNGRNPYTAYTSQYKLIERPGFDMWGYGGGYYNSNFTIPSQNNYATYIAYVAEKDGVLDLEVTDLKFKYANTAYAIVKNFSEVLSGTSGGAFANWSQETRNRWEYSVAADVATRIGVTNVSVKKGDTVAIVFDRAELGNGDGFYDLQMTVKYRKEYVGDAVSYEHKTGGKNYPVTGRDADGYAILADGELAYEIGSYDLTNGKAYPYGSGNDKYGVIYHSSYPNYWTYGAMYHDGKMILPGSSATGCIAYVAYTAEYDGKVDININNLTFQREGTAFTVVRNFKDVLVADGGTLADYSAATAGQWYHSALNQTYSFVIRDITVKEGDTVAIVFDIGRAGEEGFNTSYGSENNRGPKSMNIDMQYSERHTTVYTSSASEGLAQINGTTAATVDWSGSAWTPIVYKSRNDAGVSEKALIMDTFYDACSTYIPASLMTDNDATTQAYAMISTGRNPGWGKYGSFTITSVSAAGYRYIAEKSGEVRFSFDAAGAYSSSASTTEIVMGYAIFVNGVKVWPYGDNNWYNMRQESRDVDYTAELNDAMPRSLFVAEGDCIEILARSDNGVSTSWANRGSIFMPKVTYSTEVTVSARLNDKFAVTLQSVADLADGYTAKLNGKDLTVSAGADGTYTVYGIAAREMGYTLVWNYAYADTAFERGDGTVTVPHVAQTWSGSYADLMKTYIDYYAEDESELGKSVVNLAASILNYGAAAQTYFAIVNGEEIGELVNATLTDAQKAIAATGTWTGSYNYAKFDDATFTPYSATLLLGDSVSLKLVVSGTEGLEEEGYQVKFTCGGNSTFIDLIPCMGGGGQYKAILHGLTPTQWNEAYEMTVVDANGNAVSATVTYSVATYALRTAENAEVKAVTDKMLALYEMAVAYLKAVA